MKNISAFCLLFLCILDTELHAQDDFCLKFADTVHLQARLITVNFPDVEGDPYCYFIVFNDKEKDDVVNKYLTKTPQKQDQLYLISHLSTHQFVALKKIIEDTLYNKLSVREVCDLLAYCADSKSLPPEISSDAENHIMKDFYYKETSSTKSLLLLSDENCVRRNAPRKISKLWGPEKKVYPLCYEVCDASFDSWGVILEMGNECNFFFSNDYESNYTHDTLKLFIPLFKRNQ